MPKSSYKDFHKYTNPMVLSCIIFYILRLSATSMSDRYLSTSKGPAFCQYATSKGQQLLDRGYWNPMPVNSYLSGDGLSPCYRGAGYYVPSERAWMDYKDHRSLPSLTRRDAIHMDSEDKYREFTKKRDSVHNPSGWFFITHCSLSSCIT